MALLRYRRFLGGVMASANAGADMLRWGCFNRLSGFYTVFRSDQINGREMTDAQARIVACALQLDLLILDRINSTFRYINSDGSGVRYLNEAQGIRLLRSRHADAADRHSIILYTRGHYRGLRWQ